MYSGLDEGPIKSRVKGLVSGWEPGTVFELENGQQWKVLQGSAKLRKTLRSPEILVVPGIAGRWFLQVDEDMPKAGYIGSIDRSSRRRAAAARRKNAR